MQYLNGGTEGNYYYSLSSIAKEQITDALWYTGVVRDGTASEVYKDERSNTTGITGTTVNYRTSWVGKVGLIYPSDFAYAGKNCGEYTINNYKNEDSCGKTNNWLTAYSGYYWTISPFALYNNIVVGVDSLGSGRHFIVNNTFSVRPSLYLSSTVKIIDGNGDTKPYILIA